MDLLDSRRWVGGLAVQQADGLQEQCMDWREESLPLSPLRSSKAAVRITHLPSHRCVGMMQGMVGRKRRVSSVRLSNAALYN